MLDPNSEQFSPTKAFAMYVERQYGGFLGDLNSRSVRAMYSNFRNEFPDFKEYEADIETALANVPPNQVSDRLVLQQYFSAKGIRQTQKERAEAAKLKGQSTLPPTPTPAAKVVELSQHEKAVAVKMFPDKQDPEAEYRKYAALDADDGEGLSMKVPIGGGKKA